MTLIETANNWLDLLIPDRKERRDTYGLSHSLHSDLFVPCRSDLSYMPFQLAGIEYAERKGSCIIGDEPGLGKTIEAIGYMNLLGIKEALIICPVIAKFNWLRELKRWLIKDLSISLDKPNGSIIITNYERIKQFPIKNRQLIIMDEFHKVKNIEAQRTSASFAHAEKAELKLFLDGTPIWHKPMDIYPVLHHLNHKFAKDYKTFAESQCKIKRTRFGVKIEGVRNEAAFQKELRSTLMVRRLKKDALPQLPKKIRQLISVPAPSHLHNDIALQVQWWGLFKIQRKILQKKEEEAKLKVLSTGDQGDYLKAVINLEKFYTFKMSEISTVRKNTTLAKIPYIVNYIQDECLGPYQKIIVWAHHLEAISMLSKAFPHNSVSLTGRSSPKERLEAETKFQNDPSTNILIASMRSTGSSINLTACELMIFAELDWVSNVITQAEDRAHRIGLLKSLLIQHFVFDKSIDAHIIKEMVASQEMIEKSLNT